MGREIDGTRCRRIEYYDFSELKPNASARITIGTIVFLGLCVRDFVEWTSL